MLKKFSIRVLVILLVYATGNVGTALANGSYMSFHLGYGGIGHGHHYGHYGHNRTHYQTYYPYAHYGHGYKNHHRRSHHRRHAAEAIALGAIIGFGLSYLYYDHHQPVANPYASVARDSHYAPAVKPVRRLFRDRYGNCFEIRHNASGYESRIQLDPSGCNW